jgi:hypothetical protein
MRARHFRESPAAAQIVDAGPPIRSGAFLSATAKPIEYLNENDGIFVTVQPHQDYGMATIWDADIRRSKTRLSSLGRVQQCGSPAVRISRDAVPATAPVICRMPLGGGRSVDCLGERMEFTPTCLVPY